MPTISPDRDLQTVITTFEMTPGTCQDLLDELSDAYESFIRHQPGFVAAGLHVNLYLDDRVQIVHRSPEAHAYLAHARVEAAWLESWDDVAGRAPTKILAVGEPERVEAALSALAPRFEGRLWLTRSMPPSSS